MRHLYLNGLDVMKRLMFVAPALSIGGLQFHLVRLVNYLRREGYPVTVAIFSNENDLLSSFEGEVNVVCIAGRSSNPLTWLRLSHEIRKRDPDIVIGWSTFPSLVLCILKSFKSCRTTVITELNYPPLAYGSGLKGRLIRLACRLLYGVVDKITANSDQTLAYLKKRHGKVCVARILNPVELAGSSSNERVDDRWCKAGLKVLAVGRLLNRHKGFDVLLDAMPQVVRKFPDARLLIVGEGPDRMALEAQIESLALKEIVYLPGADTNIVSYLGLADVFVVPSNYEGFPNVLIEAMMSGAVVVSTDCQTGPAEIVVNGTNGYLVSVGNPDELASGIIEAGSLNNFSRSEVGALARQAASRFSVQNAGRRYVSDIVES